jgi:hypothetical protein
MPSIEGYTAVNSTEEWPRLSLGIQHFHPIYEQTCSRVSDGGDVAEVIVLLVCDAVSLRNCFLPFETTNLSHLLRHFDP